MLCWSIPYVFGAHKKNVPFYHEFYLQVLPLAPEGPYRIHPCELPAQPRRFRDNNMGLKYSSTTVQALQKSFENMYDLKLQYDGGGPTRNFQQAGVTVTDAQLNPKRHWSGLECLKRLKLLDKNKKFHTNY